MDKKDQQLAEQIRDLPWDDVPDAAHRDRLEADLLQAWTTRRESQQSVSRWRVLTRKGKAIMSSRITRYGAVAAAAVLVVLGLNFLPKSSPQIVSQAWALEQSIAAMEEITTIYAEGLVLRDKQEPFKYYAKRDPQTGKFMFRWESLETAIYDGQTGYGFSRDNEQNVTTWQGLSFGMLKLVAVAQQMQLWVRGQTLANLKQQSRDWKEVVGKDEQTGHPCVFVTCSYDWISSDWIDGKVHFWLEFDMGTRLPVRAKAWGGKVKGSPTFDFQRIVFDEPIPDERFQYRPTENATIVDAGNGHALLEQAKGLVANNRYPEAIPLTQQIISRFPEWWGASEARMLLGYCYISTGEPSKALEPLEQGFTKKDGSVGDMGEYFLAVAYERLGRPEDAIRAYIRASLGVSEVGRTGMFPDPDAREAIVQLQDSLFAGSIPDWASVIDLRADRQWLSLWARAEALRKDSQFQRALDTYQQAIAALPQNYYRRRCAGPLMMGLCYEGLGLKEEAIDQFRKCVTNHGVMDGPDNWAVQQAEEGLARLQQVQANNLQRATNN